MAAQALAAPAAGPEQEAAAGLLALGEGWHNNHHAFPTSARHGLDRGQVDVTATVISGCARLGLVWDVVTISDERKASKRLSAGEVAERQLA